MIGLLLACKTSSGRHDVVDGSLTRPLVRLHGAGRADTYGAALLDIAQDHILWLLDQLGHFGGQQLTFKGGTSLRKCRLGKTGRFSTDLDFVAPSEDTVLDVCEAIDGATVSGFQFSLRSTRGDGRHWTLLVRHPELGDPDVPASIEFARRSLIMKPEQRPFVVLPVHARYGFELPTLPVIREAEACAEKLARSTLHPDASHHSSRMAPCGPSDDRRVPQRPHARLNRLWVPGHPSPMSRVDPEGLRTGVVE